MMRFLLFSFLFGLFGMAAGAQTERFHSPVDIPFLMSGSFGEPRPNHFHCGIDVKTQGVTGKRILSVCEGYVSRLTVGYDGFGNAVYVTHPNGLVSVYCHLDAFVPALKEKVLRSQYEEETERVDVRLSPEEYPVKAGELIAYSGNTGASLAPHLHLELRKEEDGMLVDPLPYFLHLVTDDMKPVIHGIKLCPCPGEGVVNGVGKAVVFAPSENKPLEAWGKIGAAVWADDYMNGTQNKFGIRSITLRVDGKQVFQSLTDRFMPEENPLVNSWGDYAHFRRTKNWYLKSFADPGNTLSLLHTDDNRGWVDIREERDYRFEYELEDLKGNLCTYAFTVRGERDDLLLAGEAEREVRCKAAGACLLYRKPNVVQGPGMELRIPLGALTADEVIRVRMKPSPDSLSILYTLHDDYFPLMKRATLMIAPQRPVEHPEKCYIESSRGYVGGEYKDGWFTASVRELGETYGLAVDTVAPQCKLSSPAKGKNTDVLRYTVTDKGSGIKSFKAYVDGRFVLFTSDRGRWTCRLKETPLRPENKSRKLVVYVTDRCGNETTDEREIIY